MTMKATYVLTVLLLTAISATANDTPSIRICVGPLADHSGYQLSVDKIQADLTSELSHKRIKAVSISGHDLSAEMAANNCEYLLRGEFSKITDPPTCPKCPVVDERKYFALRFTFALRKSTAEEPVYSNKSGVIDKNPKTCADDNVWETVNSVRQYFKSIDKAT